MSAKDRTQELAELAYLWESGEWKLQVTHHSRGRVIFVFPEGRPRLSDLMAVRALIPRFTNAPITDLKQEIESVREFVAGEFPNLEARNLAASAKARGLKVRIEDVSFVSHLPVREGACLLIEDGELARLVGQEMERRGVAVVHAEAD